MATSIFFTESKDFKLIRERILSQEESYLVYVYADTSNIKIPKELIRELPIYGNNLIWVNTVEMDTNQIINHIVLTIGQFLNAEEELNFFVATKTPKYNKTLDFLASQNIPVEIIQPEAGVVVKKKRGPGRLKKSADTVAPPKKSVRKTRSKKESPIDSSEPMAEPLAKKKMGRPRKKDKKVKPADAAKTRKPRIEKTITKELIEAKIAQFPTKDPSLEMIERKLFGLGKVKRPKYLNKLSEMIEAEVLVGQSEALKMIDSLKAMGVLDDSGKGNRLIYKD